ncbi:thiamine biosynthesis lipoprotein [Maribacter spongiicola]|uniref:FAD:protein FMN transferase n=1 Tax=Maribacter spongiicola TaxID=1206753 RepID=A0A4R7K7Y2_9FLAO|nr:FAD:protein FMN transferase [Maribacter spongiicola]TDT47407.1 thiamine biosynthesis lipoprotein [Maribacter spongiicola]
MTCFAYGQEKKYVTVKKSYEVMGGDFDITVVSEDEELGYIYIQEALAEVQRIEKLISSWDAESETSLINKNAGIKPVSVSWELYNLIERSIQISEITNGAFDITFTALNDIWKLDGSMEAMPTSNEVESIKHKIGYKNIILDSKEQTVYLNKKGMRISFGGIGKGFAADKAKSLLVSKEVKAGIINIDGDITTWGTKVTGDKWLIGVVNPDQKGGISSWIPILESSVATSGGDGNFIISKNKKYTHIINPVTGYPATGILSVSVFAKSAELSDALATSIFVMGIDAGLALINQLGDTEVIIVDSINKLHKSNGILLN